VKNETEMKREKEKKEVERSYLLHEHNDLRCYESAAITGHVKKLHNFILPKPHV
jgi:hypothetical protein